MHWDNGRSLPINVDEDLFRKLTDEELEQEAEQPNEEAGMHMRMI